MSLPTVQVVDDDPAIAAFVTVALEERGYRVLDASGGAALALAYDAHPDVILLGVNMPGMDGVAVSQRLRADPATAHIPIIAMSAYVHVHATALPLLVNDRLPKPFLLGALYETVARWLPARHVRPAA